MEAPDKIAVKRNRTGRQRTTSSLQKMWKANRFLDLDIALQELLRCSGVRVFLLSHYLPSKLYSTYGPVLTRIGLAHGGF